MFTVEGKLKDKSNKELRDPTSSRTRKNYEEATRKQKIKRFLLSPVKILFLKRRISHPRFLSCATAKKTFNEAIGWDVKDEVEDFVIKFVTQLNRPGILIGE